MKVLVVDDEKLFLTVIDKGIKEEANMEPTFCTDPYQALELLKTGKFDLLWTDIEFNAPISGVTLLKEGKTHNPDLFVILSTGYDDRNILRDCIKGGADKIFFKPYNAKEVIQTLKKQHEVFFNKIQLGKYGEMIKRLYDSVEYSPISIVITDVNGLIEYVNPQFEKLTGYEEIEIIGKSPKLLQSGIHTSSFYKHLWETITSGKPWSGEFCNKKKDGSFFWEKATIVPSYSSEGEIINYIALKQDITEIRLKSLEFDAMIQALPDLIFVLDNMGNFINAYPDEDETFFVQPKEFLGKNIEEVFKDRQDIIEKHFNAVRNLYATSQIQTYDYELGNAFYEVKLNKFNGNKNIAIVRDITEFRQLKILKSFQASIEALTQSNKMTLEKLGEPNA